MIRTSIIHMTALLLGFLPVMAAPGEETSQLTDLSLIQLEQRLSEIDDELATLATFSLRGASGSDRRSFR